MMDLTSLVILYILPAAYLFKIITWFHEQELLTSEERKGYIEYYDHDDVNRNVFLQRHRHGAFTYEAKYYT